MSRVGEGGRRKFIELLERSPRVVSQSAGQEFNPLAGFR
jgi:hypothetical protein